MIGLWSLLVICATLFEHTVSIPGLNARDLLLPTRTNIQDISKGAHRYLSSVSTGLHKRRLLWLWGDDNKDENAIPTSRPGAPYTDDATTTERPSRWNRWMGKVGGAFKKVGSGIKDAANATKWKMKNTGSKIKSGIKDAANATKWKMKKAGSKIKSAFKSGYRKIKLKIRGEDDKLRNFAHRLKIKIENGNEKALRLFQRLGMNVHVEDNKVIGIDVEDEIDTVSNILKEEGVMKEKSTTNLETVTPHYKVTNYITQPTPVMDDLDSENLSTPSEINIPLNNISNLGLPSLSSFSPSIITEISTAFTELMRLKLTTEETKHDTTSTTKTYVNNILSSTPKITETTSKSNNGDNTDMGVVSEETKHDTTLTTKAYVNNIISSTPKITETTSKPNNVHNTDMGVISSTVGSVENKISTMTSNVITEKSTPKHTEILRVTDTVSPLVYTTKTVTTTNKISTLEPPKITTKIVEVEQPFETDSPSILEDAYYNEYAPGEGTSMDEEEEEEVYSPPPFPDIFHDSRIKDRLQELYEKGDFTHSELSDLFDPDYYEYDYDY